MQQEYYVDGENLSKIDIHNLQKEIEKKRKIA